MNSKILIDPQYRWKKETRGSYTVWWTGDKTSATALEEAFKNGEIERPQEAFAEIKGNYAAIVEGPGWILAVADKIRSYPVFYVHGPEGFAVSNSARALKEAYTLKRVDRLSLLEFRTAGYVTGRETLFEGLYQLQAGEFLHWEEKGKTLKRDRYYLYYSRKIRSERTEDLVDELDAITDKIFARVIEEADGAAIWVPLSGGLDSRLVLCKLKQLGYDRLQAFSYGAKGNYEAKAAEEVAEKVGVPWDFAPATMKEARAFFSSATRKKYWDFSDGLCSVPNMQDIHAFEKLKRKGKLPLEVVVVNGQSGDFITGGHLPESFATAEPAPALLLQRALEKHFSQDLGLLSAENVEALSGKVLSLIGIDRQTPMDRQQLASLYEWWEWQERQCKYVVNGQRIYDFYALRWSLPLWADEYLDFWVQVPLDLKIRQKLYRSYLERRDLYGCFRNFNPEIWRWPGISIGVVPLARAVKLLFGRRSSDRVYHYFSYFGHNRQFYAPYGLGEFLRKAKRIRRPVALNIERWVRENLPATIS